MSSFFDASGLPLLPTTYRSPLAPSRYTSISPPSPPYAYGVGQKVTIYFTFECGHQMSQEITSTHNLRGFPWSTPRPMEGQCCDCSQNANFAKEVHEQNTAGLRVRAEHIRGNVVKFAKPGYEDEDLYETFREILREITIEWKEEIERHAKGTKPRTERIVGPAFERLEKEMEGMLEKVGIMVMSGKDELAKETASRKLMVCGDDEGYVPRSGLKWKLKQIEGIRKRMKELKEKMEGWKEYREVVERVEGEFAELGKWANCLLRGEEYLEERRSHDEGDPGDSDSD